MNGKENIEVNETLLEENSVGSSSGKTSENIINDDINKNVLEDNIKFINDIPKSNDSIQLMSDYASQFVSDMNDESSNSKEFEHIDQNVILPQNSDMELENENYNTEIQIPGSILKEEIVDNLNSFIERRLELETDNANITENMNDINELAYKKISLNLTEENEEQRKNANYLPVLNEMNNINIFNSAQRNSSNELIEINNSSMLISRSKRPSQEVEPSEQQKENFDNLPQMSQTKNPVSALTPIYSFGFNRHVPIINLSTDKRCFIFYSCSHLGVIYDYYHNEQLILQGHCNSITCTTASSDKRWLGTGDQGENSVIIIWDCNTGLPVRTMFEPHPNGVVAISLTPDARYLATLSAENTQTFAVWDWTTGEDIPLCSASLSNNYGLQNFISFNVDDVFHVCTTSETQVLFFNWDKIGNIKYFAPTLTDQDFNKPVGKFCNTIYLPKSTTAISATTQGLLVVWEGNVSLIKEYVHDEIANINIIRFKVPNESTPNKKAVKLVPIHDKAITVLTLSDKFIVTGDIGGDVKFFDYNYMLIFWYQDWNFGPITSISSSIHTGIDNKSIPDWKLKMMLENSDYPDDATIPKNKFAIHDFIVGTATTIFATITVKGSKIKVIFRDHDQSVYSVHAHPTLPLVATGSYSGLLRIWNYEKKESVKTRLFNKIPIKCLCFDHRGVQLAIGFANGELRILDTHALKDVTSKPFQLSKVHITHIQFSEKSEFLATVDGNYTTTLYRPRNTKFEEPWVYVGRYRAHYKRVVDLLFGRYFDTETPRLFTLGEDRRLVEYDLYNASEDNLPIFQETRVEQSDIPLTVCWYPEENGEGFLVTANNQYKLKMYNHHTKMCRYTFLGPTFGSPVKILKTLPKAKNNPVSQDGTFLRYIAYANHNKVGLIKIPLNGNPYNYMTMIAHPRGVTSLCCSFDGTHLISVGEDFIVTIWKINLDILEAQANLGGSDMAPYYELIEGGEFGPFINELKDYFYYSMIRTQGIDSLQRRKVDVVIDISEVSYIMRAIGFYPSEEEIENMTNELKFQNYFETGQFTTKVDLNSFLKVYINHRPAFGIASEKIEDAFRSIIRTEGGELSISQFLNLLINKGENISEEDLAEYLATLLGFNGEGGSLEMEEFYPDKVMKAVNEALPQIVTAKTFIENIICMKIIDRESETIKISKSTKKLANSTQT